MSLLGPLLQTEIEVTQTTHDDLNCNANIQVGNADVSTSNRVPVQLFDGAGDSVMDDANNAVRVNIIAGGGTGGTAMTDDAAFTVGATSFTPVGGTYRTSRDNLDDNDGGACALTQKRAQLVCVETPAGDTAMDDTNDAVRVNVVTGVTAVTEYTEGAIDATITGIAALGEGTSNNLVVFRVDDNGSAHVSDGGNSLTVDNSTLSVVGGGTEATALRVTIASDSTGVLSIDDNGGSLTVDGTVSISGTIDTELSAAAALADNTANPTVTSVGSFPHWFDGSTWDRARGDSTDGLLVNLGANNDVAVTSSALPTGAATSANQATIIGHIDGVEGILTTIDADTGNISTKIDTLAGTVSGTEIQVDVLTMPTTTVQATNLDIRDLVFASDKVDVSGSTITATVSGAVDTELTTADLDTGGGTDTRAVVGLVGSASGGGQLIPGSSTDGLLVNLGANNDVTAAQSGTWTVQPGNTANTTPWLVSVHDGTTAATVRELGTNDALNVAIVDGSGNQVTNFSGGGTQYTEDVAAVTDPIGTQLIARRRDGLASETTTDGDNTAVNSTARGELYVSSSRTATYTASRPSVADATSTSILAAAAGRRRAWVINNTQHNFFLQIGAAAVADQGIPLAPSEKLELETAQEIRAIQNSGGALDIDVYSIA